MLKESINWVETFKNNLDKYNVTIWENKYKELIEDYKKKYFYIYEFNQENNI
jgi:hypothetical protein